MRVIIFSITQYYLPILLKILNKLKWELVLVITTKGPRSRRSDAYLELAKIVPEKTDILVSDNPDEYANIFKAYSADIALSFGHNYRVRQSVLNILPMGVLNIHDGLLPSYRGPNAAGRAIYDGVSDLGITIHQMSDNIDEGDIIHQLTYHIDLNDTKEEIRNKFLIAAETCWKVALNKIATGNFIPIKQNHSISTIAPKFSKEECVVHAKHINALQLHNRIRAMMGIRDFPDSLCVFACDTSYHVKSSFFTTIKIANNNHPPGSVFFHDKQLFIQCNDAPLQLIDFVKNTKRSKN